MSSPASSNEEQEEKSPDVKEEHEDEDSSDKPTPKKEEKSSSPKKAKQNNDSEEKDGDESDEGSEEEGVGLLDRPVEVSGSRERKKVQRLEVSFPTTTKNKLEIPEGSGEKLGDCPRIELQIQKTKVNELKNLHRILFSRIATSTEIRKNIRKFSGFTFKKDSPDFEKKKTSLEKFTLAMLKQMCDVLDTERGGTKEEIVTRIMEFLMEPKASGKKLPQSKRKSSSKSGKKRDKKEGKNASSKKKKSSSHDEDKDEGKSNDDVESEDEQSEEEEKSKAVPKKKESQAKQKKTVKPKQSEKKSSAKPAKKKKVASSEDELSSDDEPLVKKTKSPPTNEEIKTLVKKILDSADLQEITMKKVIKQVFEEFPDFDLSDKKEYIKATVKSISGS